jgi:hypothetical protein
MKLLPKTRQTTKKGKLTFVDTICELTRRGDIYGCELLLRQYWSNKTSAPWHLIHNHVQKYWSSEHPTIKMEDALLLIRDAVFGSLGMHSLSLQLEVPTSEVLGKLLSGSDWKDGKRKVRAHYAKALSDSIDMGRFEYLEPSALRRDGFGYLVTQLEAAQLKELKAAKPAVGDKVIDLKSLHRSVLGRRLLRDNAVSEASLPSDDPRSDQLLQAYEHTLLELEIDASASLSDTGPTEQLTLNGTPVIDTSTDGKIKGTQKIDARMQEPLTDYIAGEAKSSPKSASRQRGKGRREKKKTDAAGGKKK